MGRLAAKARPDGLLLSGLGFLLAQFEAFALIAFFAKSAWLGWVKSVGSTLLVNQIAGQRKAYP